MPDLYGELAKRLYISREYAKKLVYLLGYDGRVDPWIDYLVKQHMTFIHDEVCWTTAEPMHIRRST